MKITRIKTKLVQLGPRNSVFVAVETNEGITGYGETLYKRKSKMVEAGIHELARYLVGKDPTRIEDHFEKMYRDAFLVGGGLQTAPISAVEIALWDILGKSLGAPVYKLLGGPTRDRIPVYCHCLCGPTPEAFAANAKDCVDRGYHALKATLPLFYGAQDAAYVGGAARNPSTGLGSFGYSGTHGEIDRSHKETEILAPDTFARIRDFFVAAREAVGSSVHLMLDCHGRLNATNALRLCEALRDLELLFIEEPVPPENETALAFVTERSPVPIATGERWSTIYDARRFLGKLNLAAAQPDVVWCGGLAQAKKIAALAEAEYVGLAPHNPNGPVATVATLHLAASVPNLLIVETIGSQELRAVEAKVVQPLPQIDDGCLLLPCTPGLGMEIDWDACDRYPYQPFEGWR